MYCVGQTVVYGIHGVCSIANIESRKVDRKVVEYFVLVPVYQPEDRYYIPTGNQAALSKLRPVVDKAFLESIAQRDFDDSLWTDDENQRKQRYREMITSAHCDELLSMIRLIHRHKQMLTEQGKKLHQCDENFLRDAQRLVTGEVSYVMGLDESSTVDYIIRLMEA